MQKVLVLGSTKKPLMPCHPARARQLLKAGRAAVYRRYPFTIILKDREDGDTQDTELKYDPGSKITGIAVGVDYKSGKTVIWAANLEHKGHLIKKKLDNRRMIRQSRRYRKTRYRQKRFLNRKKPEGWLPPSLMSRVYNVKTWTERLIRYIPITSISVETIRFDTQLMQNPDISGVEYQQGELSGYEVREYLLEKWGRKCAYCGKENVPLEIEHITPKSRGGSNRISNLTLACHECNQKKNNLTAEEFGHPEVQKSAKQPLKDVAAVNATRYAIGNMLKLFGLPVTFWSGGRTKFNRTQQHYPKSHWIDAACVGETGAAVSLYPNTNVLQIKACGHGSRQMCCMDKFGFPRTSPRSKRIVNGFKTGDIVMAVVPTGKKVGQYVGKVAVRTSGSFNVSTQSGVIQGISYKYCSVLHRADGYSYHFQTGAPLGNKITEYPHLGVFS